MNEKQLHILQHSLGVDQYGQGKQYRNRFVTGPESDDFKTCCELVEMGYMVDCGPQEMFGGMHLFYVKIAGIEVVRKESPKPPKLSRSQLRYRQWIDADCGLSFGEYLKLKPV